MNVLSSFQAPSAFLNVEIIEAKNLTPTDPNGMLCIYVTVNYYKWSWRPRWKQNSLHVNPAGSDNINEKIWINTFKTEINQH